MHFKCKVSFSWCQKTTNKGELSNFPAIFSHSPSLEHCHLHGIISCKLQTLSIACCRGKSASFLLYWLLFKWLTAALKGRGGNVFCVCLLVILYTASKNLLHHYLWRTCEELQPRRRRCEHCRTRLSLDSSESCRYTSSTQCLEMVPPMNVSGITKCVVMTIEEIMLNDRHSDVQLLKWPIRIQRLFGQKSSWGENWFLQ